MKILIAAIHYPVASGRYLMRALQRLGHDVRTVGPSTGGAIWGMQIDEKWAWAPTIGLDELAGFSPYWRPDLVITADSGYTLGLGLQFDCPHVVFGMDNHVRDYRFPGVQFDALFLAHSWGARMGEPHVHWCPPGYDPVAHTDLGLILDVDVMCLGFPYPERLALIGALAGAGLKTYAAIGPVWDEYNALYNRAKIGLVRSSRGDLTQRFLENMAQGCCVLADRVVDADKLGFAAGVDYWPYSTPEEAVREAKMLLDSGRWRAIAANGQRKVQGHTWDARAAKMLETVFEKEPVSQ